MLPNELEKSLNDSGNSLAKDRAVSVFRFLSEFHKLRFKETVDFRSRWHLPLSDFPDHESVLINRGTPEVFLSIQRVNQTPAPEPPARLRPWISVKWNDPSVEPRVKEEREISRNDEETDIELFDDDLSRPELWKVYLQSWRAWAKVELPVLKSFRAYERMYDLRSEVLRNPDSHDLYIADGIFLWSFGGRTVLHPVLLQKVEISFDANDATLRVGTTGSDPQLFNGVVSGADEIDVKAFAQFRDELVTHTDIWPLAEEASTSYFTRLANSIAKGRFSESIVFEADVRPVVFRDPMFIRIDRGIGIGDFISQTLQELEDGGEPSPCLMPILGLFEPAEMDESSVRLDLPPDEDDSVFFTKPANDEQLKIVHQHRKRGNVVVQGPPGTGKSHTIANLIGHFLAEGKSVLVTAETTKALKVLRKKVDPALQPLCISVMESDSEGRELLRQGIAELQRVKRETNDTQLTRDCDYLVERRRGLIRKLAEGRRLLFRARQSEFVEIHACGETLRPSEAGKIVYSGQTTNSWIPGEIEKNSVQPLTESELDELYESNSLVYPDDEKYFTNDLVDPTGLVSPEQVRKLFEELTKLGQTIGARHEIDKGVEGKSRSSEMLTKLLDRMEEALSTLGDGKESWRHRLIDDGHLNGSLESRFNHILSEADQISRQRSSIEMELLKQNITISDLVGGPNNLSVLRQIHEFLQSGKKITFATKLSRPSWKDCLEFPFVNGQPVSNAHEVKLVIDALELRVKEQEFDRVWIGIAVPCGLPESDSQGQKNDILAIRLRDHILLCLNWSARIWNPLKKELEEFGIDVSLGGALVPAEYSTRGFAIQIDWLSKNILIPALVSAANFARLQELQIQFSELKSETAKSAAASSCPLLESLALALNAQDIVEYSRLHAQYLDLVSKAPILRRRIELLNRIRPLAREWATSIAMREGVHGKSEPPGRLKDAWKWSLLNSELQTRHSLSPNEISRRISETKEELAKTTSDLARTKAWIALHKKVDGPVEAALKRYGRLAQELTGIKAASKARAAKEAMDECAKSVPVWIMPISRVATSFNTKMQFDVVIMDEASQIGLAALAVLQMAKTAIIVGDEEQNEPNTVGIEANKVMALASSFLSDIKGKEEWDERMSVFNLADGPYAGGLCLLEHFRCVPEIICFSSELSYDGKILPLRDSSGVKTKPHVIHVRVPNEESGLSAQHTEAAYIVSLLASASEQPEYKSSTFGVVTLRGSESEYAKSLREHVKRKLSQQWWDKHNFQCGTSREFQGDEREVVFLAMGDGVPEPGTQHRLQQGTTNRREYQKRYNVAASRAQNQLWVISSFGLEHVQSNDIRYKLLDFALHPEEYLKRAIGENPLAESEFERLVFKDLSSRGYKLTAQFPVGKRRIDIVAEYKGHRCAIECDGEQFHGPDQLENDMARQSDLERAGNWKFVRIRGSRYFRDPEGAIREACAEMSELGIEPTTELESEVVVESDLVDRILIRAQQIRKDWEDELAKLKAEDEVDDEPDLDFSNILAQ